VYIYFNIINFNFTFLQEVNRLKIFITHNLSSNGIGLNPVISIRTYAINSPVYSDRFAHSSYLTNVSEGICSYHTIAESFNDLKM
jgi:hypothetical protein